MSRLLPRGYRYRTGRRFVELTRADARMVEQSWGLRLMGSTADADLRRVVDSKLRGLERTRSLVAERLSEIIVHGRVA